ncbi:AbfB domain-containing protein [Streptomyces sp. NPDC006739]|uniref:AbfB domain-containing protein n=1 Tax=Streptomyces sp. NPDC006739 TaxID=3364763 RepID=UPI0036919485
MHESTPQPPRNDPWENGWAPDTSRAPGTRRLWLAGGLAVATVVACVTAIAVNQQAPVRQTASPGSSGATTDNGPGLLSFASPSSGSTTKSAKNTGLPSATPTPSPSPSEDKPAATPTASAEPSKSPAPQGGSTGSKPSATWRSVDSVNYPDRYWHVSGSYVKLDPPHGSESRQDSTFNLVKGLWNPSCYSFATHDGLYLRHQNFVLRAESYDGSSLFKQDATFCPQTSPFSDDVMFQSVNYPNYALRHQNFQLRLDPYGYNTANRQDFFFRLVDGLS